MVLAAAAVFGAALFLAPRHGILARWWRHVSRSARIRRENTLKAVYHVLEDGGFRSEQVGAGELAARRRETIEEAQTQLKALRRHGLATLSDEGDAASLTPAGWQRACEIVRNHRLWELYLTNAAQIPADHVHEDAEKIEHVLGEETVRRMEKLLDYARRDPHGRLIPGWQDIRAGGSGTVAGSRTDDGRPAQP
jgi:manganese/zinc/iron transport system permease protein